MPDFEPGSRREPPKFDPKFKERFNKFAGQKRNDFPNRPPGFEREEPIREPVIEIPQEHMDFLNRHGKEPTEEAEEIIGEVDIETREQEKRDIAAEIPEDEKKRINELVVKILDPKNKLDPIEALKTEADPTYRQFGLDTLTHAIAFKHVTKNGTSGRTDNKDVLRREAQIYNQYKLRVFAKNPA